MNRDIILNAEVTSVAAGKNNARLNQGLNGIAPARHTQEISSEGTEKSASRPSSTITYNAGGTLNKISIRGANIDEVIV